MQGMNERGIAADIHFPVPDYRQAAMVGRLRDFHLPETERACAEVFTVPSFPEMTEEEVEAVTRALAQVYHP
jgi:dTDP-4-amino-4,6-dideoxygalactose transaminase